MDLFSGDTEETSEDIAGRKKSRLKSLKTRLFGRSKRAGGEGNAKLSQSASDITAGKGLGSEEDLACSQGMMGSRALSHDSIFLADQVLTDAEPARVLSQENVHSKIKALQMKLQLQKLHLGPPPMVMPIRRAEDPGSRSEEDGPPHSPLEISGGDVQTHGALTKTVSQPFSRSLSPIPKPAPTRSATMTPSLPLPLSVPSNSSSSSSAEPPLDFSTPVQFTTCLDTSAARHRMSIKPRNQRASTKKRLAATDSTSHIQNLNNIDHPESVKEEAQELSTQGEVTLETGQGEAIVSMTSQRLRSKSPEVAPVTSEAAPKPSSSTFLQQDPALPGKLPPVPSQVLRVKPHRPADLMSSERPHSSFIPSELKDKREADFDIQIMSHDKRNPQNKTELSSNQLSTPFGSVVTLRSSSAQQQVQGESETTRGIKRPTSGSGSFHLSITTARNRDGERPRSGSFVGVVDQTEARHRTDDKPFSSMREREELRDLQSRGGAFAVGRLRQDGALQRSSAVPWDRRDSLKKVESAAPSKNATTDAAAAEGEEVESSQEVVEEAVEAQETKEEEGKTPFGIKLRSTSQSLRFRSDTSSKHNSKPPACEEESDKQKRQEISDDASCTSKKLSANISSASSACGELQLTDPAPSGLCLAAKHNLPSAGDSHIMPKEVQTTTSNPKEVEAAVAAPPEPQPASQTASSEVSWMSLAMEKTRSLQQLFTSRFPRDFTGTQATSRPQAQVQSQAETLTGAQTQTVIIQSTTAQEATNQPSTEAVRGETVQSRSQAQTVKPSLAAVQQKTLVTPPIQSNTSKDPLTPKHTPEHQSHPSVASQSASHPAAQTIPSPTIPAQSPSHSPTQTEPPSQAAHGSLTPTPSSQQIPPWSNRGFQTANQLKTTTAASFSVSTTSSAAASPPVSAVGRGEKETVVQEKPGGPTLTGRRVVWTGSVSERAAFLEKRAEWTAAPGTKGVELRKAQTEVPTSGESPAAAKTTPLSKDAKPEGRQWVKPAESSPTKVPDRPREDKWPRKNMAPSSSPSSSPTMPSALQSMTESGQPSWMELAKRKSMAWSDKSMD